MTSQDFMDPELFSDFIVEAKEHLETIEPNLLELEKSPDNIQLLNEIFRPMHSLKGASGFLGLNKINHLAHKSENILDELRKGEMVVTSEIMDVILAATDALRQLIDNLAHTSSEGDVAIEEITAQIDAIMHSDTHQPMQGTKKAEPEEKSVVLGEPTNFQEIDNHIVQERVEDQEGQSVEGGSTSQAWIEGLMLQSEYALIVFGEGHLKDFIDEAVETIENLNAGLLAMEKDLGIDKELINDLFRYFHNLKGNSAIIGFQELNGLTHEAETLLNQIRHDEMTVTQELIDLLLLVVDVISALVNKIDTTACTVRPFETSAILACLQKVVAGGAITLPYTTGRTRVSEYKTQDSRTSQKTVELQEGKTEEVSKKEHKDGTDSVSLIHTPTSHTPSTGEDSILAFAITFKQQLLIIQTIFEDMRQGNAALGLIDGLHRALGAIQRASNVVGLEELSVYAERTAGLVAQARDSAMDFSLMLDILKQEVSIIKDMGSIALAAKDISLDTLDILCNDLGSGENVQENSALPQAVSSTEDGVVGSKDVFNTIEHNTKIVPEIESTVVEDSGKGKIQNFVDKKDVQSVTEKNAELGMGATPNAAKVVSKENSPEQKASSTIRVDHEKLDHLMNLIGELIINRNRYTMLARSLEEQGNAADVSQIAQDLSETTYSMARISDELQDTIMKVRMVPVASVFSKFPRLVRDLSRKSGKDVELILEGEDTELDKTVVEVIGDPLVHLIRNAVDHGIEASDERLRKNKPVKGRVTLRAFHKGNSVSIEIEDDGKGLDPEKIREVAVRKGVLNSEEAKQLNDREAIDLIFAPGFSSAEKITDISGRGVGMDVVRTNIKNLKGSIAIQSEVGKGSKFVLSLPLTLAIIDALMVSVSGEMFAIPLDAVSETTKLDLSAVTTINGRKAITLRGEVVGLIELSEILNLPVSKNSEIISVVIIHNNERRLGVIVDRLLERQEIVIKPLGAYLGHIQCISGATIMGDGSVILILDPHEIYSLSTALPRSAQFEVQNKEMHKNN